MVIVRKVNLAKLSGFQHLLAGLVLDVYCKFRRCDFIFDMYPNNASVKDIERKKRVENVSIEYTSIDPSFLFLKHMDSYWPSKMRKTQKLTCNHIRSTVSPPNKTSNSAW